MPTAPRFTLAGAQYGFVTALPLAVGVLIYALVFGVLAAEAKLSALEAVLMSATVFSATAQVAGLKAWTTTGSILTLAVTIAVVNARYLLYGAALRPWMAGLSPLRVYGTLFALGDNSFTLSMRYHAGGGDDAGFVLGSALATFLPWTLGTLAGHLGGSLITDPAAFGLDFMLVAFSTAMVASMWRGADRVSAVAAAAAAVAAAQLWTGGWVIITAGLTSAVVAYARFQPRA